MLIDVLTLFPGMFAPVLGESVIGRAVKKKIVDLRFTDIREFSQDKHKKTDDYPYGGGGGMVMTAQPIYDAWLSVAGGGVVGVGGESGVDGVNGDGGVNGVRGGSNSGKGSNKCNGNNINGSNDGGSGGSGGVRTIYMSPQGATLTQQKARELSREKHLAIICGHYEGVDERLLEILDCEEISIGDYVLTGGEIPAMALIDCVVRLLPGALSGESSGINESHYRGQLEFPQYTRPERFMGMDVPEVLLKGNHADIDRWRRGASIGRTRRKRADMLAAQRRRLQIGGTANMRDLGGFPAANGATTRWRVFLRSDRLFGLTEDDKYALRDYGLTTVIDMRSKTEAYGEPEGVSAEDGFDCYNIPLLSEPAIDKCLATAPFEELYILFAERGGKKIGKVFSIMANSGGVSLFHCHAGKDRTGIIAALLLMLAGVPREDIVADYEVSGTYYVSSIKNYNGDLEEAEEAILRSSPKTIEYFMRHIIRKYGSAETYLKQAGVTNNEISTILDRFLTR